MKSLLTFTSSILIALCLFLAFERRAFAYVDPGSGLFALQSFASVMAATGYFLRKRIRALFSSKKPANGPTDQSNLHKDPTKAV